MKLIAGIAFYFLCFQYIDAQSRNKEDFLYAISNSKANEIQLRWAPSSFILWQLGNKYGYRITKIRTTLNGDLMPYPISQKLLPGSPVKPYPKEKMERLGEKDSLLGIMGELIYGSAFENQRKSFISPSTILKQSSLNEQRFGFALLFCDLHFQTALATGLAYQDPIDENKESYIYKIEIDLPPPLHRQFKYRPATVFVKPGEQWQKPNLPIPDLDIVNNYVTLGWRINHLSGYYVAYEIERSVDGIVYYPATELPFVQMGHEKNPGRVTFTDSVFQPNSDSLYYRIRGVTPFGDKGNFSLPAVQRNYLISDFRPSIDSIRSVSDARIKICWHLPDSLLTHIKIFTLSVSNSPGGQFVPIFNAEIHAKTFCFKDSIRFVNNYYKLSMQYRERNKTLTSLPFHFQGEDSITPAPPLISMAKIDSLGKVTLRWKANAEADLAGYRVFRANSLEEEFIEVTNHLQSDTTLSDSITLNTLTRSVYYKILASDRYYNSSPYSEIIKLDRRDTIAPAPAIISNLELLFDSIRISMIPSHSSDLYSYQLIRVDMNKTTDTLLLSVIPRSHSDSLFFTDTKAEIGMKYRYLLYSLDSSGNQSYNCSGIITCEPGFRKAITIIEVIAEKEKKCIRISWEYALDGIESFIVYRSKQNQFFQTLTVLDPKKRTYEDLQVNINNQYRYKIVAIFKNGSRSQMSKIGTLKY